MNNCKNLFFFLAISFIVISLSGCGDDSKVVFKNGDDVAVFDPKTDKIPNKDAYAICRRNEPQKTAESYKACYMDALTGNAEAQLYIGIAYMSDKYVRKDSEKAKYWLLKAGKQKNIGAAFMLANVFLGESKDYKDTYNALVWFTIASELPPQFKQDLKWINDAKVKKEEMLKQITANVSKEEVIFLKANIQKHKNQLLNQ